ncbi:MAG: RHS repeat protein, partial [Bacteroidetes bacterium]|nr:RHS repeat protein [Bacteroidota bacterium]
EWNTKRKETISYKDAIGRVKKIEFPDGNKEHYFYNLKGKLTLVENGTDPGENQLIYEEMDGLKQISYSYNKGDYSPSNLIAYAGTKERNKWVYRVTTTTARDGVRVNEISDIDFNDGDEQTDGNTLSTIVDKLGRKISYTDPDMGTWTYEYDINGNLVTQIDAKGDILGKISFEYDKLNRTTVKHGADTVYYCYDGLVNDRSVSDGEDHGVSVNGQLTSLYFGSGKYSENYSYDDKNKKYEITKTIDGKEKTYSSTLDELGRIKEETYPDKDREKLLYTYNYSGNIDSFFGTYENNQLSDNYIYELRYNIFGKIISFNQGNWSKTIYDYNEKDRLS